MPYRLCLTLLWLAAALAGDADGADDERFLRPFDETIVKSGPLSIVARGEGELRMDGKPVKSERPAAGGITATVTPGPGSPSLSLGSATIRFYAGTAGAPAGWKEFRAHPPAASCDTCHAVKQGTWEIKGGATGDNCLVCHDAAAFIKLHQHNPDILPDCEMCHYPHGSTVKSHLKLAKAKGCKQCHG